MPGIRRLLPRAHRTRSLRASHTHSPSCCLRAPRLQSTYRESREMIEREHPLTRAGTKKDCDVRVHRYGAVKQTDSFEARIVRSGPSAAVLFG